MYVDFLRNEYLSAVAELEKKSYPEEFVLGLQNFEDEYEKYNLWPFSRCIFEGGKLVCYIVAYKKRKGLTECPVYISDINCPNPRYLKRLLLNFFYAAKKERTDIFCADMRENSYRLLVNQKKRHNHMIQILEDRYIPEYYLNGEASHCVTFQVDIEEYLKEDWKSVFQLKLDDTYLSGNSNVFRMAFQYLREPVDAGVDLYERKNMEFVINRVKELILGYYQMFGEKIPADLQYYLYEKNSLEKEDAFSKTISTLESYGYQKDQGDNQYEYDSYRGILCISRKTEIYNTKYVSSLAGFRWLWRKNIRYLNNSKKHRWFVCFNRYGVRHELLKVPYLSRKQYFYYLKKLLFVMQMEKQVQGNINERDRFQEIVSDIYSLLKRNDAEECIRNIVERHVDSADNYYHDWSLITYEMKASGEILTEGAIKAVLTKSYNYALKISRDIKAIRQIVLMEPFTRRMFDIKEIRKRFSYLVRQNKDCAGYIKSLSDAMTVKYSKKLSIPLSEKKLLVDFIERMRKYCPTATVYSVYQIFGVDCLTKFIKGTYPCIFKNREIKQSFYPVTELVNKLLESRTRQAKHVYWELRKCNLLSDVLRGSIDLKQYKEILQILTHYNVNIQTPILKKLHEFRTVVEMKGSPEFLVAGDASVCCMSFGSAKAADYAKEEGFGIINVYYRNRIIANSLIWINEPYQCLVLDNIEVHPNYVKFEEELKNCFWSAAMQLMQEHLLRYTVQGVNYNDLQLYKEDMPLLYFDKMNPVGVGTRNFYSDAGMAKVIAGHFPDEDRHLLSTVLMKEAV